MSPRYDYNLVVIGAGSAGLVSAYLASSVKAKVALVEKHQMGGDCLNTGCVPSKALIRSAKLISQMKKADQFGLRAVEPQFEFSEVMKRVHSVVKAVAPHDSVERYESLGVECISGEAKILTPYEVRVGEKVLRTRSIVIATGASPIIPPIEGVKDCPFITSETLWSLNNLPKRLVVLGGGPIGCEMAQCFARFGSQVTIIEQNDRLLAKEDPEVGKLVEKSLKEEGIEVLLSHRAVAFLKEQESWQVRCEKGLVSREIPMDRVLLALGRKPRVEDIGLESLGVDRSEDGTIWHDSLMRTSVKNIFVCGDVAGPYQLTHVAAHQAWYASMNAIFSPFSRMKADYRVIPRTTFTDPEVAHVGENEQSARQKGLSYEVTRFDLDDLDRAIADGENIGFVKVLTDPKEGFIYGATIVGTHAGESLIEFVSAMKNRKGLDSILGTVHAYPTFSEGNKYVAGAWKKKKVPDELKQWSERILKCLRR